MFSGILRIYYLDFQGIIGIIWNSKNISEFPEFPINSGLKQLLLCHNKISYRFKSRLKQMYKTGLIKSAENRKAEFIPGSINKVL